MEPCKVTNTSKFSHDIYFTFPSFLKQLECRYRVLRTVSYVLNIINNFLIVIKGLDNKTIPHATVWFQKLSMTIPPQRKGFVLTSPQTAGNSSQ